MTNQQSKHYFLSDEHRRCRDRRGATLTTGGTLELARGRLRRGLLRATRHRREPGRFQYVRYITHPMPFFFDIVIVTLSLDSVTLFHYF